MNKGKMFRDPVHGYIVVPLEFMELIDAREFQRMRRIRQLGLSFLTYHGAEHSRFSHSLGVFHLFMRLEVELERKGIYLTDEEKLVGRCAALLHDIGHGPLSHVLEKVLTPQKNHEDWTAVIIEPSEQSSTEVSRVLMNLDKSLPRNIQEVFQGSPRWQLIRNIISSQLDIDRMDYLLRDALMTGTSYGSFDLNRLLSVLEVNKNRTGLIISNKGLMAAAQFVFARYYAYWQIYFHKTTRGAEKLLQKIWKRAVELFRERELPEELVPSSLLPFFLDNWGAEDYLLLDDYTIWSALKAWQKSEDGILSDLSSRIVNRRLFKPVEISENAAANIVALYEKMKAIVRKNGYDPDYYLLSDFQSDVAYDYYTSPEEEEQGKPPILVFDKSGILRDISRLSEPVRAIAGVRKIVNFVYVPDDRSRIEIEGLVKNN